LEERKAVSGEIIIESLHDSVCIAGDEHFGYYYEPIFDIILKNVTYKKFSGEKTVIDNMSFYGTNFEPIDDCY
jgi:hypothetical protein